MWGKLRGWGLQPNINILRQFLCILCILQHNIKSNRDLPTKNCLSYIEAYPWWLHLWRHNVSFRKLESVPLKYTIFRHQSITLVYLYWELQDRYMLFFVCIVFTYCMTDWVNMLNYCFVCIWIRDIYTVIFTQILCIFIQCLLNWILYISYNSHVLLSKLRHSDLHILCLGVISWVNTMI